jgi:hypothetical protein
MAMNCRDGDTDTDGDREKEEMEQLCHFFQAILRHIYALKESDKIGVNGGGGF